jgi:hypothetical protein
MANVQMTNDETKARRSPHREPTTIMTPFTLFVSSFEFRHSSFIRHSNFVIRISDAANSLGATQ